MQNRTLLEALNAFEAQLAVQLTFNQKDAGSTPAGSTLRHHSTIGRLQMP